MNATDDLYQVTYDCHNCGKSLTIDGTNLARISSEFVRLGWLNELTPGADNYIVTCPGCVRVDEALELEREQQADEDYFLAGTGR